VDDPIQVDPPYPVGTDAVQVLTVHQAKGLEFPVVVLWDGKGQWNTRVDAGAWKMERDRRGWIVHLHGLTWEEPAGLAMLDTEKNYLLAERRRVVYVAATRARDLLVVPSAPGVKVGTHVCADLLAEAPERLVHLLGPYADDRLPPWATPAASAPPALPGEAPEREIEERWGLAVAAAARPRLRPASVSGEARMAPVDESAGPAPVGQGVAAAETITGKPRTGRFGSLFGTVVHRAVGLLLDAPARGVEGVVRDVAREAGLMQHLDAAAADVRRALAALMAEGVRGPLGPAVRVEYPVAAAWDDGVLLGGYIDLVAVVGDRVVVIDVKTDMPPAGAVERAYPEYARQVRTYGALLQRAGVVDGRVVRCGLLFTGDGGIRWVE
jgi:ATP-dependent helicase/nuclease subunit A